MRLEFQHFEDKEIYSCNYYIKVERWNYIRYF